MQESDRTAKRIILLADDDEDDFILFRDALKECGSAAETEIHWVRDGVEVLDYLLHRGKCVDIDQSPYPDLLILDMNMPRMNGREVLREIKQHPALNYLPVIAICQAREDVHFCYRLGAASVIKKPNGYEEFVELMKRLHGYWFETVILPIY